MLAILTFQSKQHASPLAGAPGGRGALAPGANTSDPGVAAFVQESLLKADLRGHGCNGEAAEARGWCRGSEGGVGWGAEGLAA